VGPEHSLLLWAGRVRYEAATDDESLAALTECCRSEGILPAIESAHALAGALKLGRRLPLRADGTPPLILVNLSGRGDKDVDTAVKWFDIDTSGTASTAGQTS
jgi:tryptophan synthase beta chain